VSFWLSIGGDNERQKCTSFSGFFRFLCVCILERYGVAGDILLAATELIFGKFPTRFLLSIYLSHFRDFHDDDSFSGTGTSSSHLPDSAWVGTGAG
jgi:hypothetical protein